ncbi:hypothetical protein Q669_00535 [Labrenzia sp. C1B10]|nr:hypothetical protein Q669_00535 [Labrenzia sp. C1B10]ERS00953.1 hypothetical protein Q675_09105 [Labrenzia sp. C1B70]
MSTRILQTNLRALPGRGLQELAFDLYAEVK